MTVLICALALTGCARGGSAHAVPAPLARGGHAVVQLEPIGDEHAWACIHEHEGAWNDDTGNGYYGGLQFDRTFILTYGRDMIRKYRTWRAGRWSPRDQMVVAYRAFRTRGYYPWPNTARDCRLI